MSVADAQLSPEVGAAAASAIAATATSVSSLPKISSSTSSSSSTAKSVIGQRKNGKHWHGERAPFRKAAGLTPYAKRAEQRERAAANKKLEREMKEDKAATRDAWIANIKDRRAKKAERERFQKMEEKMHRKRVDRLKRREKRNKMLGK